MRTASIRFFLTVFFIALAICISVGNPGKAFAQSPAAFSVTVNPSNPRPGEFVRIDINAKIASGWHLYSLVATPAPGPSATAISIDSNGGLAASTLKIAEDKPEIAYDPNFSETVAYHVGHATFTIAGQLTSSITPTEKWPITIHFQTCNSTTCLPPTSKILDADITPGVGQVRPAFATAPILPPAVHLDTASSGPATTPSPQGATVPDSWLGFAAAAFGAGLLALLTPCVFPLIPVTFGFFTKQIGEGSPDEVRRKLIVMAGVYASGIIISFTALGLIAAVVLGASGANRVAANPWFNLFFGVLFVVFAFSFFEAFHLTLPPSLMRLASPVAGGKGVGGVLLMGLAFVFAAFTCTAPFIGTVLVAAATASTASAWLRPVVGMLCFSLALALPFFALAVFPGALTKLPRSGGWLTRFKASLGFVELAYALTYFSKADLVWQAHFLTRPVFLGLWAMIAFAGSLYLLGLLRVSAYPEEPTKLGLGRGLFVAIFSAVSIFCLYAMSGRPVSAAVGAYLPPEQYGEPRSNTQDSATSGLDNDSAWMTDLSQAELLARQNGKPIFVDFTGYTCTNCRYVELNTFTKQPVTNLLENQFNRVRLYTDGGKDASSNQAFQQHLVGTVALPYYAIVTPDSKLVSSIGGSAWSVDQFASFLKSGDTQASSGSAVTPLTPPQPSETAWGSYSAAAIASAAKSGTPIIIDFTATWCTNCHAIEKQVFTAPSVSAELPKFTTLRMDLTDFYGAANAEIESRYNILALPAVVFLNPDGKEIAHTRVTGLISADQFLVRMKVAESTQRQ